MVSRHFFCHSELWGKLWATLDTKGLTPIQKLYPKKSTSCQCCYTYSGTLTVSKILTTILLKRNFLNQENPFIASNLLQCSLVRPFLLSSDDLGKGPNFILIFQGWLFRIMMGCATYVTGLKCQNWEVSEDEKLTSAGTALGSIILNKYDIPSAYSSHLQRITGT